MKGNLMKNLKVFESLGKILMGGSLVIAGLFFAPLSLQAQAAPSPNLATLLTTLDGRTSFVGKDFSAQISMISQDPEKGLEKNQVRMFRRDSRDEFLILFESPSTKRGQGYLRNGDSLFFYDAKSRKFTHQSMKESFEGSDARNSDFNRSTLSKDYKVATWEGGEYGRQKVWILNLEALNNEVTYPFLKMWVTQESLLILKTEDYSLNKRHMRTSVYPSWSKVGDSYTPNKMIFTDELIPGKETQISLSKISTAALPDEVFTKPYLERVSR